MFSCLFLRSAWAGNPALSEDDDMGIERVLKMLNKPYVKSFKDEYGVVFDCVDIYKQPAIIHSSRTTRFRYRLNQDSSGVEGQHFAMLLMDSEKGSKFQDAGALLEVDSPYVPPDQSSSAQIILLDNSSDKIGCIQSSWHADGYQTTGCLNLLSLGFVLTSPTAAPGMVLPTGNPVFRLVSAFLRYLFRALYSNPFTESGDWYVFLNQESVGYFPKQIFNNMDGATEVQMGGITYAPPGQKSPPMGNGVAPSSDTNITASTFTHIEVQGANVARDWVTKDVDQAIYNIVMTSKSNTGPQGVAFQYGGPGGF
ncbi:hypothetical protein EJB05_49305, partial [Eragrostis curvula]